MSRKRAKSSGHHARRSGPAGKSDWRAAPEPEKQSFPFVPVVLVGLVIASLIGAAAIILRAPAATASVAANSRPAATAPLPAATQPVAGGAPAATSRPAAATAGGKTPVTAEGGVVRLAAADYADGRARFYTLQVGGKTIPFFLLKSSDGAIRAAFDACDVCFAAKKGYHQEGDVMVCNNCGTRFPSVRINVEVGGCNPGPLPLQTQGDSIIIKASDIQAGARYF